jgi:outer membrane lipoprotein SlyB
MWIRKFSLFFCILAALLSACESLSDLSGKSSEQPRAIASNVTGTGVIESVELIPRSQGLGLGTLAGAVIGGVLGSQVGGGSGTTAATVAGVAGGAYVGHEIEKRQRSDNKIYKITISMDDGTILSFAQEFEPDVHAGDKVKITNGVLSKL